MHAACAAKQFNFAWDPAAIQRAAGNPPARRVGHVRPPPRTPC